METIWNCAQSILGLGIEPKELTFVQISLRGFVVFAASLIMLRMGARRALAQKTTFDTLLIVLLASVLSRAINGSAAFFATLGASFAIVFLHRFVAHLCCWSHTMGRWIKGDAYTLVREGKFCHETMRRKSVSEHDIEEDMRLDAQSEQLSDIKVARLERSGDLSFIEMKK